MLLAPSESTEILGLQKYYNAIGTGNILFVCVCGVLYIRRLDRGVFIFNKNWYTQTDFPFKFEVNL